jgi:predicted permease
MSIPYVGAVEILGCNYVIIGIGALFARFKKIDPERMSLITHITTSLSLPLMIFREASTHPLTFEIFKPLLVGFFAQLTMHLILIPVARFFVSEERVPHFLKLATSIVYCEFAYFGGPIVQIMFSRGHTYICAELALLLYAVVHPLHSIILNYLNVHIPIPTHSDDENSLDDLERVPNDPRSTRDVLISDTEEEDEEPPPERPPKFRYNLLLVFLTPVLIAFILGVIWSAIGVKLPFAIEHFCMCHAKALMAPGIAAVGVHIFSQRLRPTEFKEFIFCLVCKLIVFPGIAIGWCYLFGLEKLVAAAVVLLHAMPMGLLGYDAALVRQWDLSTPTFTFVWSNLLGLPVLMLWVTAINELGLFGGK